MNELKEQLMILLGNMLNDFMEPLLGKSEA